jgi:histone acetyltransferase
MLTILAGESGWTPDANAPRIRRPPPNPEHATMEKLLKDMQGHHQSWPFLSPVSVDDVPDYYETIKHPMDMRTMEDKLAAHRYPNMEAFITDAQLMWDNCMSFNPADTVYHKCAKAMAKWFKTRIANRVKKEEPT